MYTPPCTVIGIYPVFVSVLNLIIGNILILLKKKVHNVSHNNSRIYLAGEQEIRGPPEYTALTSLQVSVSDRGIDGVIRSSVVVFSSVKTSLQCKGQSL
jgi:hypothetical protein